MFFDPISEMRMTIVYFFIMIIEGNTFAFQDSNLFYLSKYELVCDMFVHVYMCKFFVKLFLFRVY